jgi:uncharacterized protein YcnI
VKFTNRRLRAAAVAGALVGGLAAAPGAWAHAEVSPSVVLAKSSQLFTLAVPTEKEGLTTTKVELTPPGGFGIDSFAPAPGWKRQVQSTGSGANTQIQKVTWTGGHIPTDEDAIFEFIASPSSAKKYAFNVRQTYSDGSLADWTGSESSDLPAPVIEAKSSLGGGSGNSTLPIVGLVVGAAGVLLAVLALVTPGGGRPLA